MSESGTRGTTGWNQFRGDNLNSGMVGSLDIPTPELVWKAKTEGVIEGSPVVVNGKVYIGSKDNLVYCYTNDTGVQKWAFDSKAEISCSPLVTDNKVYIGSNGGKMHCLNAEYGTEQWAFPKQGKMGQVLSSPKVYKEKLYFGSDDGRVYCIYPTNGSQVWNYSFPGGQQPIWSTPALKDNILYIGGDFGRMVFLDTGTGEEIFNFTVPGDIYTSVCIFEDDILFASGTGKMMYRYNGKTGVKVWEFATGTDCYTSAAVFNGSVYFSDYEHVFSIPYEDPDGNGIITPGEVNWKFESENWEGGSSPIVIGNRLVIGGEYHLHCLFLENGTADWSKELNNKVLSSPVYAGHYLYYTSFDKHIYCLKGIAISDEGLAGETQNDKDEVDIKLYLGWMAAIAVFVILDVAVLIVIIVVAVKRRSKADEDT